MLRSSIRATALCLAGYRSSMSFLRAVKAEERTDVASRTRGNAFLLPPRSAFSAERYFAKEFNGELPHNFQLRPAPASLFGGAFLWTFIISAFTTRDATSWVWSVIGTPRAYLRSGNDVCWRNRRVCQWQFCSREVEKCNRSKTSVGKILLIRQEVFLRYAQYRTPSLSIYSVSIILNRAWIPAFKNSILLREAE